MTPRAILVSLVLLCGFTITAPAQKVSKQTIESGGKKRTYLLLVPETATPERPAPLLVLLHGSGRNGQSLMDKWKGFGNKEGVLLIAPDANTSQGWHIPEDGPEFLHDVISEVKAKHPVDPRRMYVFGHSAGASFALYMGLFESEYFAAVAIHAGGLQPDDNDIVERAARKIPIYIAVGTVDRLVPLEGVRATRDMLVKSGFEVQLIEMKGHDHWYYDLAPKINAAAWEFLKPLRLSDDPRYTRHSFKNE
jgi:poly(3-hydroxybutyrate) depolymerase